jgi:tRNA threonylcarbamoyladenosine biosynthesis protein TsaE
MKETFVLKHEDLGTLAKKVVDILSSSMNVQAKVVLLEGDLGAGKTTFTKVLANELGIDSDVVHSPTFILKKSYDAEHSLFKKLVHIDAYRFTHPQESKVLRLEDDLKDPQTVVVVEWPSKMNYLKSDVEIIFKVVDDDTREVTLIYEENL